MKKVLTLFTLAFVIMSYGCTKKEDAAMPVDGGAAEEQVEGSTTPATESASEAPTDEMDEKKDGASSDAH
ncbi:MAG: hypothetical protein M9962_11715 [Oligoflexia bacterium]|nr:hypothetical protein [Oligoflexia bacterium]